MKLGLAPETSSTLTMRQAGLARAVTTLGPVALVSAALSAIPVVLLRVALGYERSKLRSQAQLLVLRRNYLLQMINLWSRACARSAKTSRRRGADPSLGRARAPFRLILAASDCSCRPFSKYVAKGPA